VSDGEQAWAELLEAKPAGWYVGQPSYHNERQEWVLYAFDPSERAVAGVRKREWQALAPREVERCLREIGEGRVAK